MLTEQEINSYKNRLEEEHKKLIEEIKSSSRPDDFGGDELDNEDEEADQTEELDNKLSAVPVLREKAVRIEEALRRIENGEYGKCQKCGSEISKEILDIVPESFFCEDCKQ